MDWNTAWEKGNREARKGIRISRNVGRWQPAKASSGPRGTGRGRPPADIFRTHRRKLGLSAAEPSNLELRRACLLGRHAAITSILKPKFAGYHGSTYDFPIVSPILRRRENPEWGVFFAAELGWLATRLGERKPYMENVHNRPKKLERKETFVRETSRLWTFMNRQAYEVWAVNDCAIPDVEKCFKTALCCAVGRKLIMPRGGSSWLLPSPREISQIWYVIFGEHETHDAIKKRLPTVAYLSAGFELLYPISWGREYTVYPGMTRAIARKYGLRGPGAKGRKVSA